MLVRCMPMTARRRQPQLDKGRGRGTQQHAQRRLLLIDKGRGRGTQQHAQKRMLLVDTWQQIYTAVVPSFISSQPVCFLNCLCYSVATRTRATTSLQV